MSESPLTVAGYTIDAEYDGNGWCYVVSWPDRPHPTRSAYIWPTREIALIAARVAHLTKPNAEPLLGDIHKRIATLEDYMHRHDARLQKLEGNE